jgi:hypothetical protein
VIEHIYVPWNLVEDALRMENNVFSQAMQDLLELGYPLDVGVDGGCLTFNTAAAFRKWFDGLKAELDDPMSMGKA